MPLTVSCDSPAGYDAYVSHGDIAYLKYEDDWAFGFPGKLARCAVPVFESDALAMRTFIASHETNYRLAKTGPVLTVSPKRWGIYRTDYSPQGPDKLCRLLRDKFDGPPCPATAELGAKMACLRHARAAPLDEEQIAAAVAGAGASAPAGAPPCVRVARCGATHLDL